MIKPYYEHNGITIYHGDCREIMAGLDAPDLIIADPPYGISIVAANVSIGGGESYDIPFGGRKASGTDGAAKPFGSQSVRGSVGASNIIPVNKYAPIVGDESTETAVTSFATAYKLFPKSVHVWWGANYYADSLPPSSCWYVWDKNNTGNFADAELAWCSKKTAVRLFKHTWNGLLKESERNQRRVHPTQKPVALMKWIIQQNEGCKTLLDPFMGSAPTLIAAKELGLNAVGIEMSEEYCEIAAKRLAQEVLQFPEAA